MRIICAYLCIGKSCTRLSTDLMITGTYIFSGSKRSVSETLIQLSDEYFSTSTLSTADYNYLLLADTCRA